MPRYNLRSKPIPSQSVSDITNHMEQSSAIESDSEDLDMEQDSDVVAPKWKAVWVVLPLLSMLFCIFVPYQNMEKIFQVSSATERNLNVVLKDHLNSAIHEAMEKMEKSSIENRIRMEERLATLKAESNHHELPLQCEETILRMNSSVLQVSSDIEQVSQRVNTLVNRPVNKTESNSIEQKVFMYEKEKLEDYALVSNGARVVYDPSILGLYDPKIKPRIYTSDPYLPPSASTFLSIFHALGMPLTGNTPEMALTMGTQRGNCWAFKGTHGILTVQFDQPILPTSIILDHNAHTAHAISAPRDVIIWGYNQGKEPVELTSFTYDVQKRKYIQRIPILKSAAITAASLQVNNNHGNTEYTCIYRFQVFGAPK